MMIPSSSGWSLLLMLHQLLNKVSRGVLDNPLGELADPVIRQPGVCAKPRPVSTNAMNVGPGLFCDGHGGSLALSYHPSTGVFPAVARVLEVCGAANNHNTICGV